NTLVTTPDGKIFINDTGNAGLAKGGSGDVLTGMIAAFLGRYENSQHAVSSAIFMHGFTADQRLEEGMAIETIAASDIVDHLVTTGNNISEYIQATLYKAARIILMGWAVENIAGSTFWQRSHNLCVVMFHRRMASVLTKVHGMDNSTRFVDHMLLTQCY